MALQKISYEIFSKVVTVFQKIVTKILARKTFCLKRECARMEREYFVNVLRQIRPRKTVKNRGSNCPFQSGKSCSVFFVAEQKLEDAACDAQVEHWEHLELLDSDR